MNSKEILPRINSLNKNTLMETLDIQYTDVGDDYLVATMPVNSKVHQPLGLLHGGASVSLAESVGSMASHLFIDTKKFEARGIEIAANHVKSVREGYVYASARILHKGRTTQLWQIKITNEADELVSMVKLTTLTLRRK